MGKITVRAPATTANIGPGFDFLGCALSMSNEITFEEADKTDISGCDSKFADKNNLAYRACAAVYRRACRPEPALSINIKAEIPLARGLGSSAAMLAAGAVAGNALCGNPLDRAELLRMLTEIEGHPDNLAPALFGGLTAAMSCGDKIFVEKYNIAPSLRFCALIPDFEVSTREARKVLPTVIPFKDAAAQSAHAVMLLRGLEKGDAELISASIYDVLHEPYRKKLISGFDEIKSLCLSLGAVAFFISGSGPTCIALTTDFRFDERIKPEMKNFNGWKVKMLVPDSTGTVITEENR